MGQNTARTVGSVFLWLVLRHVSGRIDVLSDVFALITLADALGTIAALRGCHLGHAAGDGATRSIHIAVADAGTASVVLNIMTESAERAGRCAVRSAETLGAVWQLISKAPTAIHIVNFILL